MTIKSGLVPIHTGGRSSKLRNSGRAGGGGGGGCGGTYLACVGAKCGVWTGGEGTKSGSVGFRCGVGTGTGGGKKSEGEANTCMITSAGCESGAKKENNNVRI